MIKSQTTSQPPLKSRKKEKEQTAIPNKTKKKKENHTHVQTRIRAIDPPPNHLPVPHKHAPNGRLVAVERQLRHLDRLPHEALMVLAVGDGAEDHFVGDGVAREVSVGRRRRRVVAEISVVVVGGSGGAGFGFAEDWEGDW